VKPCTGFENDEPIITKVEGRYQYSEETTITDMSVSEFVDVSKSCGLSTADSDGVFRVDCSLALKEESSECQDYVSFALVATVVNGSQYYTNGATFSSTIVYAPSRQNFVQRSCPPLTAFNKTETVVDHWSLCVVFLLLLLLLWWWCHLFMWAVSFLTTTVYNYHSMVLFVSTFRA